MGTTNQQALEMMQKLMQKKTKPMPERDEYLRVVIYLPIGCSGLELDMQFAVFEFPHLSVVCTGHTVVLLQFVKHHKDVCYLSHLPVG